MTIRPLSAGTIRQTGFANLYAGYTGFEKHVGVDIGGFKPSEGEYRRYSAPITLQDKDLNMHGTASGAFTAALSDIATSWVPYWDDEKGLKDDQFSVTKSLNVQFKRAMYPGKQYVGTARILRAEGNNIWTEASIKEIGNDRLVATASAELSVLRATR